jgi:hypothetical protein
MSENLIWFEWAVPQSGYCWHEEWNANEPELRVVGYALDGVHYDLADGDRMLVIKGYPCAPLRKRQPLLKENALFLSFSRLALDDDEILRFANSYGLLTKATTTVHVDIDGALPISTEFGGEPRSLWINEIKRLRFLIGFWERISENDERALAQLIRWETDDGWSKTIFCGVEGVERTILPGPHEVPRGDVLVAAQHFLDLFVNGQLDHRFSARLVRNQEKARPEVFLLPSDLRAALWLQFARAIEGGRRYHECKTCGVLFEVASPQGGRSDKQYCSDACRARRWREGKLPKAAKGGR